MGSFSSISFATVTPSLVMVGLPNFFSRTTLRPRGPRVTFTASANWLTPRKIAWRESSLYRICFAIIFSVRRLNQPFLHGGWSRIQNSQHVVLAHNEVLGS